MKKMMKKLSLLILFFLFSTCLMASEKKHFLSFVMPCYNCERTVRRSIDSIYQQELHVPFELVCTSDASTDGTLQILREYEQKYSNFHVYILEKNMGAGAACNNCVKHAQGDLIFRLDSDNVLAPSCIQRLIDLLDTTGCDAAGFAEMRYFTGNFVHSHSWFYEAPHNICDLRHFLSTWKNPASSGNYLYTRESYERAGGYPEPRGMDTFYFGFKQYATGSKLAILPNSFYWHYYNLDGYWGREEKTGNNQRVAWHVFREFKDVFTEETKRYLDSVDANTADFYTAFNQGRFKLIPQKALELLFKRNN